MQLLGKDMKSRALLRKACALRRELVPDNKAADTELQLLDFDEMVSVMHSGTRALRRTGRTIDMTLLNNLVGPSP